MKEQKILIAFFLLTVGILLNVIFIQEGMSEPVQSNPKIHKTSERSRTVTKITAEPILGNWPARSKLALQEMVSKYGSPAEFSSQSAVWRNVGSFKRITVSRVEVPHSFPSFHYDYLEHTVAYEVPADRMEELASFDSSILVNRTAGELSVRCDSEPHNILALNLAQDVISGRKTVNAARRAFAETVTEELLGTYPVYAQKLQFDPSVKGGFADEPMVKGSSIRKEEKGDAEVLGYLISVNHHEIQAANYALQKNTNESVREFARLMQVEHGKNLVDSMKLADQINVVPAITFQVDQMEIKGANDLASIVNLNGIPFEKAYIEAMVTGHKSVLKLIDEDLLPNAQNSKLRDHLIETRKHVAMHFEKAQKLQVDTRTLADR